MSWFGAFYTGLYILSKNIVNTKNNLRTNSERRKAEKYHLKYYFDSDGIRRSLSDDEILIEKRYNGRRWLVGINSGRKVVCLDERVDPYIEDANEWFKAHNIEMECVGSYIHLGIKYPWEDIMKNNYVYQDKNGDHYFAISSKNSIHYFVRLKDGKRMIPEDIDEYFKHNIHLAELRSKEYFEDHGCYRLDFTERERGCCFSLKEEKRNKKWKEEYKENTRLLNEYLAKRRKNNNKEIYEKFGGDINDSQRTSGCENIS